jgi:cytochrome oxidase Cu insertion factor (SCO1/SenC/PrrC family)
MKLPPNGFTGLAAALYAALFVAGCKPMAAPDHESPNPPEREAQAAAPECCQAAEADTAGSADTSERVQLPDVPLVDQDGRTVRLEADLIGQRVVALNFVFTSCTTSCPLLGARFGQLQRELGDRLGKKYGLVSISVDPANDLSERLKQWLARYDAGPGWSFVTGRKPDIDRVLKSLGVYTPSKNDHPSAIVLLDGRTGHIRRLNGLLPAAKLAEELRTFAGRNSPTEGAAQRYFSDTLLLDQNGRALRFYSDLLKDKTVVINTFFSTCPGSCVKMAAALRHFQDRLGDRLGKDVYLISISVDPTVDRPEVLRSYAEKLAARPGWYFLTGNKANVELILRKLGQFLSNKESHTSLLFMGNDRTGLWKKAQGLAPPDDLYAILDSVRNDQQP